MNSLDIIDLPKNWRLERGMLSSDGLLNTDASLPGRSVRSVHDFDPHRVEFLTDGVGAGEVSVLPGQRALVEQRFDFRREFVIDRGVRAGITIFIVDVEDHAVVLIESSQGVQV